MRVPVRENANQRSFRGVGKKRQSARAGFSGTGVVLEALIAGRHQRLGPVPKNQRADFLPRFKGCGSVTLRQMLLQAIEFFLKNFIVPVAFILTFKAAGAKAAIAVAVVATVLQILVSRWKRIKLSPFFIVSSAFALVSGGLDLVLSTPQYYRLEPFVQNMLIGSVLLGTVMAKLPVVEWFAAGLPERIRPQVGEVSSSRLTKNPSVDLLPPSYVRKLTLIWVIYFFTKGTAYLWLAFQVDLGNLVLLRSTLGPLSFGLLLGGEMAFRRWRRSRRLALPGAARPSVEDLTSPSCSI